MFVQFLRLLRNGLSWQMQYKVMFISRYTYAIAIVWHHLRSGPNLIKLSGAYLGALHSQINRVRHLKVF